MNNLYVSEITTLDLCFAHPKHGLVGETLICDLSLSGDLDENGFIFDFGKVKKAVKYYLDENYDHKLVLASDSHNDYFKLNRENERSEVVINTPNGKWEYQCPSQSITQTEMPSLNAISKDDYKQFENYLSQKIREVLPTNVIEANLILRSEEIDKPFHYTHGLQGHDGNCQRMAHGHRSRVHVYLNDNENTDISSKWSNTFNFKHIVNKYHILEEPASVGKSSIAPDGKEYLSLKYTGSQGDFSLRLPKDSCVVLPGITSIENTAKYICQEVSREHQGSSVRVRVSEGFNKGSFYQI